MVNNIKQILKTFYSGYGSKLKAITFRAAKSFLNFGLIHQVAGGRAHSSSNYCVYF